jgi:DNA polymerase-3 subunit delta'
VIALRPAPRAVVESLLKQNYRLDDEQAALLAQVSGGRVGWAVRAITDPDLLAQRTQALDLLDEVIGMNRAARFALADNLAKDKAALITLLELWQTYWRDALLFSTHSRLEPTNIDRALALERLAERCPPEQVLAALNATHSTLQMLTTNANARLTLEVMFLDYPAA